MAKERVSSRSDDHPRMLQIAGVPPQVAKRRFIAAFIDAGVDFDGLSVGMEMDAFSELANNPAYTNRWKEMLGILIPRNRMQWAAMAESHGVSAMDFADGKVRPRELLARAGMRAKMRAVEADIIIDDKDVDILTALKKAGRALMIEDLAAKSGRSEGTVKNRLPKLERAGLILRKKRGGAAIMPMGITRLQSVNH